MKNHFLCLPQYTYPILLAQIHRLAEKYQRPYNAIKLLAVSKSQPLDKIRLLIQTAQLDLGENYVQEGLYKISALTPLCISLQPQINWHFIGTLQSNKLQAIATSFDWVQTITTIKQAEKLSYYRGLSAPNGPNLKLCIQVNISQSPQKQGVWPEVHLLSDLAQAIELLPHIELKGLMTMPDAAQGFDAQYRPLKAMAELFTELQSRHPNWDTLSMGTSQDLEAAIAAGSTLLRLGTALFGPRDIK